MRLLWSIALVTSIIFVHSSTQAQNELKKTFSTQLFEPAIGTDSYFSVEGPSVAPHLAFGLGLMMNYQHKPFTIYEKTYTGGGTSEEFDLSQAKAIDIVENQMTANLVGALGFQIKWLHAQVGFDLPVNLLLTGNNYNLPGTSSAESQEFSATGIGDLKLQIKAMIFRDIAGFSLAFSPIISFPTGKKEAFGGEPNLSFRPRGVLGYSRGIFSAAVNAGWLVRENTLYLGSEVSDQLLFGAGLGIQVHPKVVLLASLFGRAGFGTKSGCVEDPITKKVNCTSTSNKDLDAFPMELDAGARFSIFHGLDLSVGGGTGLIKGIGSPEFRLLAGVQWSPDFKDTDGDGIFDYKDQCPTQPEDKDGFNDSDGCPDPDNDGDLIPDIADKCPNDAEDKDTFQDQDGCPDNDNDQDGIPDIKDACPFKAETKNGFKDDDGCPDVPDQDGDGVEDSKDKCPKEAEDIDKFEDLDG